MFNYVDSNKENLLNMIMKMIEFPSVPGQEGDLSEYIVEELKKLPCDEAFMDGCGNAIGILRGEGDGPNILLTGHMDVVDPGDPEKWAPYAAFKPVFEDGKIYGRGASDMKSGLAESFFTFKAACEYVAKTGKKLSGDVVFAGVVQEEPACMFGMDYFCNVVMPEKNLKFDMVYISEPTEGKIVNRQRGKVELVIKTYGKCAHSSRPAAGINALEFMGPIIQAIFKQDGIKIDSDEYFHEDITITNIFVRPGGILSTIPDYCEIAVDRRYLPGKTMDEIIGEFETLFEKLEKEYPNFKATVEPRVYPFKSFTGYEKDEPKAHYAWATPVEEPMLAKTIEAVKGIGHSAETDVFWAGTDGSMSRGLMGIPTILYAGGELTGHIEKEYVSLDRIVENLENYVAIINKLYDINVD